MKVGESGSSGSREPVKSPAANTNGTAKSSDTPKEPKTEIGQERLISGDRESSQSQSQTKSQTQSQSLSDVYASRTGIATAKPDFVKVQSSIFDGTLLAPVINTAKAFAPDAVHDGKLVGACGQTYPPGTPLKDVPGFTPRNGVTNNETIIYTNGIMTTKDTQARSLQDIADLTGSKVVGVHNSTEGSMADLAQSADDLLDVGKNKAVTTLADTVYSELMQGNDVHLMGHSQGGIITSRALTDVKERIQSEYEMTGADPQKAADYAEKMLSNVKVETFASASPSFPDGPQYVHYVNTNDLVPMGTGLGNNYLGKERDVLTETAEKALAFMTHPGEGAQVHFFTKGSPLQVPHGLSEYYLPERVPFEQAREGNFDR